MIKTGENFKEFFLKDPNLFVIKTFQTLSKNERILIITSTHQITAYIREESVDSIKETLKLIIDRALEDEDYKEITITRLREDFIALYDAVLTPLFSSGEVMESPYMVLFTDDIKSVALLPSNNKEECT